MSGTVPRATSLKDIYTPDALASQSKRWENLLSQYQEYYFVPADFVARSPGRVNIIGEHIDYSLYPVLPMAITADALLAVGTQDLEPSSPDSFRIQIANVDNRRFPPREFEAPLDGELEIDASVHEWTNYFKSGLRGAHALLKKKDPAVKLKSMRVLMDGSVPAGGGLSSSAAFVTASALAVLAANGVEDVDKKELTELAIVSERAVGVNSGGMDQSASVFSLRGSALYVSFTPQLTARPVYFPRTSPELCFLTAQSFVAADKHVTGPVNYNLRVVECSLAAAYLNAVANPPGTQLPEDAAPLGVSLHGFQETYFSHQQAAAEGGSDYSAAKAPSEEDQLAGLLELSQEKLSQEEGYTREEIAKVLGLSVADLEKRFTSRFPVRADRFKLRQRARHVFSEALRVRQFMGLLESSSAATAPAPADPSSPAPAAADTSALNARLGALLDASQASCRDLYECSCPELDELCAVARAAGAYGSRLTGAGWGGCSVHLVPADKVEAVRAAWDAQYYAKRDLTPEQRAAAVVVSRPGSGSAVFIVKDGSLVT